MDCPVKKCRDNDPESYEHCNNGGITIDGHTCSRFNKYMKTAIFCKHCKNEIPHDQVSYGKICMGCGDEIIYPWFIALYPDTKNGYCEIDFKKAVEPLEDIEIDDAYIICQKRMTVNQYYNMPDFTGF